ncbi:MAG: 2-hydroxyacid dehydrogenase, partial [Candidatus Borkfalkiaceae bacterium]|nr:2-hydroxyacid dehydrogenase [Christensenellaceae bacterium]
MKKIAFFDAKEYDKPSFESFGEKYGLQFKYFETKLSEDTADLARGCDGVCLFVNDELSASVIDKLTAHGIGVAALRC